MAIVPIVGGNSGTDGVAGGGMGSSMFVERTNTSGKKLFGPSDFEFGQAAFDFDKEARNVRLRFGRSWATFDDLIEYYDVARMPDIDGATMPLVGHVIFTRPSLNVATSNMASGNGDSGSGRSNYAAMCRNPITAAWANDYYGRRLLHMMSMFSDSAYMPLFTNRVKTYSVSDMNINTIDKGHTFFGHFIKYGTTTQEYRTASNVSIEFRNDSYQSVMKAIALWISYISIISFSDALTPTRAYETNGILDYCGSIYYLVTKMDMSTLVYWEKLTGVFPKNVPLSHFSYSDAPIVEDSFSVDFEYAIRSDPCDPSVLFDLNMLSCGGLAVAEHHFQYGIPIASYGDSSAVLPRSYEGPFALGNAFAKCPIVKMVLNDDGSIQYKLMFAKKQL